MDALVDDVKWVYDGAMTAGTIFLSLFFCLILCVIVYAILRVYWSMYIRMNSEMYKEIQRLNELYTNLFMDIGLGENVSCVCNSLQEYRRKNSSNFGLKYVTDHAWNYLPQYTELVHKIEHNRVKFEEYLSLCSRAESQYGGRGRFFGSKERFVRYELKQCRGILLKIPTSYDFHYCVSYTSPAGQNSYSNQFKYGLGSVLSRVAVLQARREEKEYQRSLMTPSLRYSILKRDDFKCKLCGRSADSGVQLEVDHIIPVSKGGKTDESNLQTLCFDCNRGKSDK